MSKPQPLRRPAGATVRIEQAIARGESTAWIVQRLHVTPEQVAITRTWLDRVNAADDPGDCVDCGLPARAVPVHHESGRATVHYACLNGHKHRPTPAGQRRLTLVRGEQ